MYGTDEFTTAATTDFIEECIAAWQESSTDLPALGRRYSETEQREREIQFDEELTIVETELLTCPGTQQDRERAYTRITSSAARLAMLALDLDDPYYESLLSGDFPQLGRDLALSARRLDPAVSLNEILQACRNAWTAGGLQPLLGQAIELTPALFAYSMLYPYSDNYMDDAAIRVEEKLVFSSRFRKRLAGELYHASNAREAAIWSFVSLIESQYERGAFPQVYQYLLEIHRAQQDSLRQLAAAGPIADVDLLRLTFTKGGTSVLADACLAAGHLSECEARFAFYWGVLLQMADDLDDVAADREQGFVNLFLRAAAQEPLDDLTSRTLRFAQTGMKFMRVLPNGCRRFKDLLGKNATALLIRAAGRSGELYTKQYRAELETYSPLRFSFIEEREQRFARGAGSYAAFFEALLLSEDTENGLFEVA